MALEFLVSVANLATILILKTLDTVDNIVYKITGLPDGTKKPSVKSGSQNKKRIKLLLDINIDGDSDGIEVSTTDVSEPSEAPPSFILRYLRFSTSYLLGITSLVRQLVMGFQTKFLTTNQHQQSLMNDDIHRKIISPRKRVSKLRCRNFLPVNYFPFSALGLDTSFELTKSAETNGHNVSFTKATEKRKRYSETDSDTLANESMISASMHSEDIDEDAEVDTMDDKEKVKPTSGPRRRSKDLFDADDDYKSAEDPDYSPDEGEDLGSSTSSSSLSHSSAQPSDIEKEIEDLKANTELTEALLPPDEDAEAEPDDAEAESEYAEADSVDTEAEPEDAEAEPEDAEAESEDAEAESVDAEAESEDDETHHNEPEYTNGQMSIQERRNKEPLEEIHTRFFGSDTDSSSPFSAVNSDATRTPITPFTPSTVDQSPGNEDSPTSYSESRDSDAN